MQRSWPLGYTCRFNATLSIRSLPGHIESGRSQAAQSLGFNPISPPGPGLTSNLWLGVNNSELHLLDLRCNYYHNVRLVII